MNEEHVELPASIRAPAYARWHTRQAAEKWNLAGLADTAELVASELVTNAVQASGGREDAVVKLWLTADQDSLVVAVWDSGDGLPVRRDAGPDDPCGRGLMIVERLAEHWGAAKTVGGKIVYCHITQKGRRDAQIRADRNARSDAR